jgi:hypothetical protein
MSHNSADPTHGEAARARAIAPLVHMIGFIRTRSADEHCLHGQTGTLIPFAEAKASGTALIVTPLIVCNFDIDSETIACMSSRPRRLGLCNGKDC